MDVYELGLLTQLSWDLVQILVRSFDPESGREPRPPAGGGGEGPAWVPVGTEGRGPKGKSRKFILFRNLQQHSSTF